LSVRGADDGGASNLSYTWSTIGTPPAPVDFSINSSNAARDTTATFAEAGTYRFLVTVTDAEGSSATSSVDVTVAQTLTGLALSPASPTVVENTSQQFTATVTDQFGNPMAMPPLLWSVRSGLGSITSAGLFTASSTFGTTTIQASSGGVTAAATITVPDEPPTVATVAAGSPSPVTGTSAALSVVGADDGGAANLVYTWSTTGTLPASVEFSANGSNVAKNTIVHFGKAGIYQFLVTITDAQGLSTTSSVNVTVNQTLTSLTLSPASSTVAEGASEQLSAAATDQFGDSMSAPTLSWSVIEGGGTIDSSGRFTAGNVPGLVRVSASSGDMSGTANITVPNEPPTIAIAATASPNPVTSISTRLSVLGADDGGEPNLTYTWSTIGSAPAPVVFSTNGTNSAKGITATFSAAGTYDMLATITDAEGATVTSGVSVIVSPTLAGVEVSPSIAAIGRAQAVQLSATAVDQFGKPLASQPRFTWSNDDGPGSVDASGLYTAPMAGNGTATVMATTGNVSGTASVVLIDHLSATAPTSVTTAPTVAVVFSGGNAISISDGDPNTASVPVSITVSATHGTISLRNSSGLSFLNGTEDSGALLTFSGNIADVDLALRGMAYTSEAGFAGTASVTVTINESGTGASPKYPIAIEVAPPAVSLSTGNSIVTSTGESGLSTTQSLANVVNTSSTTPDQTPESPSNYSSSVVVSTASFGDVVIDGGNSSSPAPVVHSTPAPAPVAPPPPAPAKSNDGPAKSILAVANAPANASANVAVSGAAFTGGEGPAGGVAIPFASSGVVPDLRVDAVPEQVFPFLAARSEMSREMDVADRKIVAETQLKVVAGSATVASFGASAAYVIWMLRGGSLLSSLLSILPAWQSIDPLPVLDNFESRKRRKNRMQSDDESIESMVDKSNSDGARAEANGQSSAGQDATESPSAEQNAQEAS
jgi:hypothetical protein